jgi:hypothetical protein
MGPPVLLCICISVAGAGRCSPPLTPGILSSSTGAGRCLPPPHSLHLLLWHLCGLVPPHPPLVFIPLAFIPLAMVLAETCPPALLALAPLVLVRTDTARLLLRGASHCVGLSAPLPAAVFRWRLTGHVPGITGDRVNLKADLEICRSANPSFLQAGRGGSSLALGGRLQVRDMAPYHVMHACVSCVCVLEGASSFVFRCACACVCIVRGRARLSCARTRHTHTRTNDTNKHTRTHAHARMHTHDGVL